MVEAGGNGGLKDIIDVDYFFRYQRRAARRFVTPLVDLGTILRHVRVQPLFCNVRFYFCYFVLFLRRVLRRIGTPSVIH